MKNKILIIGRNNWDDRVGTSSTASNIFQNFNPDDLAYMYIESELPHTKYCQTFFQISEFSLIKRITNPRVITGRKIVQTKQLSDVETVNRYNQSEQKGLSFVRRNRSIIFTLAREVLWSLGGWKSKELKTFLAESDFDSVFLFGSPLPLMNRLQRYVLKQSGKKGTIFLMDEMYSYDNCGLNPLNYLNKFLLRRSVKQMMQECSDVFVISPKMKEEYDKIFGINAKILTKGVDFSTVKFEPKQVGNPIKLIYSGQIIYGRYQSLIDVANSLREINKNGIKAQLFTYTTNTVSEEIRRELEIENCSFIMPPVPFNEVDGVLKSADILLFVESMLPEYKYIARVSFSTKIVDYLASSRAILAIGPNDIAPIEYLKAENAAIVASNKEQIIQALQMVVNNPTVVDEYAKRAFECAIRNHDIQQIDKKLKSVLIK